MNIFDEIKYLIESRPHFLTFLLGDKYMKTFNLSFEFSKKFRIKSQEIISLLKCLKMAFEEPIKFLKIFEGMGDLLLITMKISKEGNWKIEDIIQMEKYLKLILKTYKEIYPKIILNNKINKKFKEFVTLLKTYYKEIEEFKNKISPEIEKFNFILWEFLFNFYIPCYWIYIFHELKISIPYSLSEAIDNVKKFVEFYFDNEKNIKKIISTFEKTIDKGKFVSIMIVLFNKFPELSERKILFFSTLFYLYLKEAPQEVKKKIVELRVRKKIPILDPLRQMSITKAPTPTIPSNEIVKDREILLSMNIAYSSLGEDIFKEENSKLRKVFEEVKSISSQL